MSMRVCRCLLTIFAAAIICVACVDDSLRTVVMCDVDSRKWSDTVNVYYENEDTLSQRRLSLVVRFNDDFQCDTLPLMLRISLPDGRYAKEHVKFVVNRPYRASAARTVVTLPYRDRSLLHMSGCYIFSLTPEVEQCGIESIGIVVERDNVRK